MHQSDGTREYYLLGLRIMADFGATLALPAVAAAWIGTRLDARWGSKPYSLAACLLLAFALTALVIRKKAAAYGKEYQALVDGAPDVVRNDPHAHDHPTDRR